MLSLLIFRTMDYDLKAYFDKILHNKTEFDLCILVREDDLNLADKIKMIIKGKNPGSENHIEVLSDNPHKKVTLLLLNTVYFSLILIF